MLSFQSRKWVLCKCISRLCFLSRVVHFNTRPCYSVKAWAWIIHRALFSQSSKSLIGAIDGPSFRWTLAMDAFLAKSRHVYGLGWKVLSVLDDFFHAAHAWIFLHMKLNIFQWRFALNRRLSIYVISDQLTNYAVQGLGSQIGITPISYVISSQLHNWKKCCFHITCFLVSLVLSKLNFHLECKGGLGSLHN